MTDIISIPFDPQHTACAIRVPPDYSPAQALTDLKLPPYHGIVVIHGGAGGLEPDLITPIQGFLASSLVRFAHDVGVIVADGGTRGGVNMAMGEARSKIEGTFPLIGVVPFQAVGYPGGPSLNGSRYPLDPGHSHFILVDNGPFGVESDMLVGLAGSANVPGLVLIINGGKIVLNEVQMHAQRDNRIVVVRGSGRVADELADPHSEARLSLGADIHLDIVDLQSPESLTELLGTVFSKQ
jgi:hypothetical protein